MNVVTVPCLLDNYAYLLVDDHQRPAIIVDPSESIPVLRELESRGLEPGVVLCTHHHGDHIGGAQELRARFPHMKVYAHERDRISGLTDTVRAAGRRR
ncbi:MAG: MBL fold metallo-hydrolase [Polyangiaceae bacterium]|jgi:hydroxyacylglutathione hydrolase|nr:MBL fold metallo-hydrolase [Polyangiaceae bacterium]